MSVFIVFVPRESNRRNIQSISAYRKKTGSNGRCYIAL